MQVRHIASNAMRRLRLKSLGLRQLYLFSSVWLERDSVHDGLVPTLRKSLVPVHKAMRRKHATKIEDGGSNPSRGAKFCQYRLKVMIAFASVVNC